jgi:hypothetical protein
VIRRIVLALAALVVLSGCAAGHNAVTLKPYTPTDGNQANSGAIKVRNLVVVANADGTGSLIATIVNSGVEEADTLQGITVNGRPATIAADSAEVRYGSPLIFGGESANASAAVDLTDIKPGQLVDVQLIFAVAGLVEMNTLVREPTLEFAPQG